MVARCLGRGSCWDLSFVFEEGAHARLQVAWPESVEGRLDQLFITKPVIVKLCSSLIHGCFVLLAGSLLALSLSPCLRPLTSLQLLALTLLLLTHMGGGRAPPVVRERRALAHERVHAEGTPEGLVGASKW